MDIIRFYETNILPHIDRTAIFSGLNLKDQGSYYSADCPHCKQHTAFIYKNGQTLTCNRRNNCSYSVSITSYVNNGTVPHGKEFIDTLKKICELSTLSFKELEVSTEAVLDLELREHKQRLLEDFVSITQEALECATGFMARDYLETRGWNLESLKGFEFGYYPSSQYILDKLQERGHLPHMLTHAGIIRADWHNRLVYPWRDAQRSILTLWTRAISDSDTSGSKYLLMSSQAGATRAVPFCADRVFTGTTFVSDVIFVEGFFDALALHQEGFKNVLALGGIAFSDEYIQALKNLRVKTITLVMDNDEAGRKAVGCIINKLANEQFQVFIVDPGFLTIAKDPDEFLKKCGAEAFSWAIANRVHAFRYKARELIREHKIQESTQEKITDYTRARILHEAYAFDKQVTNPLRILDLDIFWSEMQEVLALNTETLQQYRDSLMLKKERECQEKSLNNFYHDITRAFKNNNLPEMQKRIVAEAESLRTGQALTNSKHATTVDELIDMHEQLLGNYKGRTHIGLCQKTLRQLDDNLLGLRKLILLAAAPNVGKTALTVQMALDVLKYNPNACLVYVSLEMTSAEILARMRCYLAGMTWKKLFLGTEYTQQEAQALECSREELKILGARMLILDAENSPMLDAEKVLAHVEELKANTRCEQVLVVVDYLQVWPVPEALEAKLRTDMELDKWRIGQMKKLRDALQDNPVIVISEARKPSGTSAKDWGGDMSDVMGSARTTYTPDIVLLLSALSDNELKACWQEYNLHTTTEPVLEEGNEIRAYFEGEGYTINRLKLCKVRDGMRRGEFLVKFYFMENRFEPFNWNDLKYA